MSDVKAFRDRCYKAATALPLAAREAVFALALLGKEHQLAAARARGVGDRLSGVGRSGARLGVGFDVKGETSPTALLRWRGPAHLVNNPTRAHEIAARRRRGSGAVLKLPDGYAPKVPHPGTAGKHFFEAGAEATSREAGRVLQRETHRSLARHFTGG